MGTEPGRSGRRGPVMSEVSTLVAALLLAAGVSAAVSSLSARLALERVPSIASVRLAELTADYVTRAAREHGDGADAVAAVREWGNRLEEALARTAARHRAVLLPSTAVAAGAPDLTAEIRAALQAPPPGDPSPGNPEEER